MCDSFLVVPSLVPELPGVLIFRQQALAHYARAPGKKGVTLIVDLPGKGLCQVFLVYQASMDHLPGIHQPGNHGKSSFSLALLPPATMQEKVSRVWRTDSFAVICHL